MNWRTVLRGFATPLIGAIRYALTLALFCGVWWYDARALNHAFDMNLTLLKSASGMVDGSGKTEAMLRAFSAEKMLLFGEGSATLWLVGRALASIAAFVFGRGDRGERPGEGSRAGSRRDGKVPDAGASRGSANRTTGRP